ncbi:hypothetical protein JKF63_00240 [Porcisia hertigi]|uniref:EF-hand domain-containing protein n=1 Tax=Porcisia hertigi TaxID=2761500 RepID=A0A836I4M2_9TRYP|nr:hypothetical protein JKF63_00240 [Porcisia hertigi]
MTTSAFLREDIREIFNIFNEDGSGTITIQEVGRALHTITGQRVTRSELLKLIVYAEDAVAREREGEKKKRSMIAHQPLCNVMSAETQDSLSVMANADSDACALPAAGTMSFSEHIPLLGPAGVSENASIVGITSPTTQQAAAAESHDKFVTHRSQLLDGSDGIDLEVFEQLVLRKLNHRSYEEELTYTFELLEDKSFAGFITKESIRQAAVETREPLTEAEIAEMFDPLVTGVPTAALDLSAFIDLQLKARKAEDS